MTADLVGAYREVFDALSAAGIAEDEALRAVSALAEHFSGQQVYFQKKEQLFRRIRNRRIREEFTGGNVREIARKHQLTMSFVREVAR